MKTLVNVGGTQIECIETKDKTKENTTKEIFYDFLKQEFKKVGFKKVRNTWYKNDGTLIYVLNVQNSQFSKDCFYMNIGIVFANKEFNPSNPNWNGWMRMTYGSSMKNTFENILKWFESYNTIEKIVKASKVKITSASQPSWGGIKKYLQENNLDENGKLLK